MTVCAVENCDAEGTTTLAVTAQLRAWNGPNHPFELERHDLDVPLCQPHHDLFTRDALKGLSLG